MEKCVRRYWQYVGYIDKIKQNVIIQEYFKDREKYEEQRKSGGKQNEKEKPKRWKHWSCTHTHTHKQVIL